MNHHLGQFLAVLITVAYAGAWWFSFWFPFRRWRIAIVIAIPAALLAGWYVQLLIVDVIRSLPLAIVLPFAVAAINFISYRNKKPNNKSKPWTGPLA